MPDWWHSFITFLGEWGIPLKVVLIVLIGLALNIVLRILLNRTVSGVVRGVKSKQSVDETQELSAVGSHLNQRAVQRTRTLGTFGRNVITVVVLTGTVLLILLQFNINVAALLTSAGFVAAGLAFGAQNLVKDLLNGIFIVFEDQIGIGDLVTIGAIDGTVENVGLRITQVRADDGTLWFIRNGEILTLGNKSQGWGKAIIDITVSATEDLEVVEEAMLESAKELLNSQQFARRVTGQPEVLGLQSLYGDRATMRLTVRTRPEAQFAVQRELRARIKQRFGKLGIQLADQQPTYPGGSA